MMPQKEYTFETYCKVGKSVHKDKMKLQNQMGGLNLQQQQYLLQQHWRDKELIEVQQKKILEQKRIISEQQRQIVQQNETHMFFQEQINSLQQQVNALSNQNQRLSADFSAKSPSNLLVRSPMGAGSSPQSSSSSSGYEIPYSHSPTPMTSTRGFPLEYARGVPPPYSTCPPPYHSTARPVMTDSKTQVTARNAGMVDSKLLGVGNPQLMTSGDRKMMSQQSLPLPAAAAGMQQALPVASSSSLHLYPPPTGPPHGTAIKVLSPAHSPPTNTSHNIFPPKLTPPCTSNVHHPLPPTTTAPVYSAASRIPLEVPTEPFDPMEFQKFADNEVSRLSEVGGAAAASGGTDSEIWQLSLPNLDVATGYGVSVNTDDGKGLDIINTKVKSTRYVHLHVHI